jgi:hypothetical protein
MYAFVVSHAHHAYAVPVAGLLVGSLLIWRRPNWHAIQGVVVAALWILALLWAGHIIVAWQIQNIPIFSGMRWHY